MQVSRTNAGTIDKYNPELEFTRLVMKKFNSKNCTTRIKLKV